MTIFLLFQKAYDTTSNARPTGAADADVIDNSLADVSGDLGMHSPHSCSLEALNYEEDEKTQTDDAHSRYSVEYEDDDDDDSLLQHPLSVCASRAASVGDLYEAEPIALEYPMCHLGSSPESYSSTGERRETKGPGREKSDRGVDFVITSPQAAADSSSPDKDGGVGSPLEPTEPELKAERMENDLLGLSSSPESSQEAKFAVAQEIDGDTNRSSDAPNSILPALSTGAISAITGVSCYDDDDDIDNDVNNYYASVNVQALVTANNWPTAGSTGTDNCSLQPIEFPSGCLSLQLPVGRPAPPSLPSLSPTRSGPFTPEEAQAERRGRVRALSESCQPPEEQGAVDTSCLVSPMPSMLVALSGPSNRRIQSAARVRRRRRKQSKRAAPKTAKPSAACAPTLEDPTVNAYLPTPPMRRSEAVALSRPGRPVCRILRKKLVPPYHDRTFHLAKELSMTERTYVKSLRLLLMPSLEDQSTEASKSLLLRLISPIYETHVAIASAAFARLVAWEKAAVAAAAARTRYQFAVANAHQEQKRRREHALRHMQARLLEVSGRSEEAASTQQRMPTLSVSSSSSNSVSGIPRSASFRHELPASEVPVPAASSGQVSASSRYLVVLSSPSSSSEEEDAMAAVDCQSGCLGHDFSSNSCPPYLTPCSPTISCASAHVCSERIPSVTEAHSQERHRIRHDELPSAEVELRDTTRCLAGLARIADVYQESLTSVLPLYDVYMTNFFRLLMESGNAGSVSAQAGGIGSLTMPSPSADHDDTRVNYPTKSMEGDCMSDDVNLPMKLPLPSTQLLLCQPARRLRCLLSAFIRLSNLYPEDHLDRADCIRMTLLSLLITQLQKTISKSECIYRAAEAYLLASEFCPDLRYLHFPAPSVHIMNGERTFSPDDPLVNQRNLRDFLSFIARSNETSSLIRVGFLQKLSKRGFQARMALLFSDRLVCCGRASGSRSIRLKIRGSISLRNARLEPRMVPSASFCSATGSYPDCLDSNTRRASVGDGGKGPRTPNPAGHYRHCFTVLGVAEELDCVTFSSCCLLTEIATTGMPSRPRTVHRVRRFVFAAPSEAQKEFWLADISKALSRVESGEGNRTPDQQQRHHSIDALINPVDGCYSEGTLNDNRSVGVQRSVSTTEIATHQDNDLDMCDAYLGLLGPRSHAQQTLLRCNPLLYVCWHRRLTVSLDSVLNANECELSGHLLRKFKNSCGWQKLWTVFTDFTLFFYKSADDPTPLACLPLLGYCLEPAQLSDHDIRAHKPDVLQLSYKSHVYFFRTDGPISFQRWYTALSSALHFLSVNKQFTESD
ncbi:unnamed protein product [Schistocephalus solidus]|uniref:PH domain-containing protein n=1 Tax=Schistocephalus solidus TaxID=70667 RepID=A0A3P7CP63_SCHSO|nr:unnamed protein product [Schistocephalus solidus]